MQEISKEEALKEMRFLFNGYKDMTSCSNPSKANIKLMQAVEMAIIALEQYQEDKEQQQGDLISRSALKNKFISTISVGRLEFEDIINLIDNAPTVCRPTSGGETT